VGGLLALPTVEMVKVLIIQALTDGKSGQRSERYEDH
jgi:hypothetical protein